MYMCSFKAWMDFCQPITLVVFLFTFVSLWPAVFIKSAQRWPFWVGRWSILSLNISGRRWRVIWGGSRLCRVCVDRVRTMKESEEGCLLSCALTTTRPLGRQIETLPLRRETAASFRSCSCLADFSFLSASVTWTVHLSALGADCSHSFCAVWLHFLSCQMKRSSSVWCSWPSATSTFT